MNLNHALLHEARREKATTADAIVGVGLGCLRGEIEAIQGTPLGTSPWVLPGSPLYTDSALTGWFLGKVLGEIHVYHGTDKALAQQMVTRLAWRLGRRSSTILTGVP